MFSVNYSRILFTSLAVLLRLFLFRVQSQRSGIRFKVYVSHTTTVHFFRLVRAPEAGAYVNHVRVSFERTNNLYRMTGPTIQPSVFSPA